MESPRERAAVGRAGPPIHTAHTAHAAHTRDAAHAGYAGRTPHAGHDLGSGRAGFTLIELVAVIVILGILMVFLVPALLRGRETVEIGETRGLIVQLGAALSAYEIDYGQYPPSTFPSELDISDKLNMGIEALVLELFRADRVPPDLSDEYIANTDGDRLREPRTSFPTRDLFEIVDPWGNPLVYISRQDYGQKFEYQTFGALQGEGTTTTVEAWKNAATGDWYNRMSYQIVSAGPDGELGTEDDIANFELPVD